MLNVPTTNTLHTYNVLIFHKLNMLCFKRKSIIITKNLISSEINVIPTSYKKQTK